MKDNLSCCNYKVNLKQHHLDSHLIVINIGKPNDIHLLIDHIFAQSNISNMILMFKNRKSLGEKVIFSKGIK